MRSTDDHFIITRPPHAVPWPLAANPGTGTISPVMCLKTGSSGLAVAAASLICAAGCQSPPKRVVTHPPGTLPVRYEEATTYSTCLVASVAMAANYLLGERTYTEAGLRGRLARQALDETRVGDIKALLQSDGLYLITLSGQLDETPPLGLRYWVCNRGYPVICVINHEANNPAFNHAVVVTGFSANPAGGPADIVHYLDPSAAEPLHSTDEASFEILWARGDHAMMVVVTPPTGADAGSANGEIRDALHHNVRADRHARHHPRREPGRAHLDPGRSLGSARPARRPHRCPV